jgi:alpha-galactosidase/6-phospho-beta-glucosidase family protein
LPNGDGFVKGLPPWAVVEGFVRADKAGLHPLESGVLPAGIAATLRARLEQIELTVEAALSGDRRLALQALAADPLVPSLEQAEAIANEALAEQAPYLPQFGRHG